MPTYRYTCTKCNSVMEVVKQTMAERDNCPACSSCKSATKRNIVVPVIVSGARKLSPMQLSKNKELNEIAQISKDKTRR